MDYIELTFKLEGLSDIETDLLPFWLETTSIEGFYEDETGLKAYLPAKKLNRESLFSLLQTKGISNERITEKPIKDKNWNEYWESKFEPVVINNTCFIGTTFHKRIKNYPVDITIDPKMSFGTGHHATTTLMIKELLQTDLKGKDVFDAGCGTGILAIASEKLGAGNIIAIDNDKWSYQNAAENISINNCKRIKLLQEDVLKIKNGSYDIILANINLNILKQAIISFKQILKPNGFLIVSGILKTDLKFLQVHSNKQGYEYVYNKTLHEWALVKLMRT